MVTRLARSTRPCRLALRESMRTETVEAQLVSFGDGLAVGHGFFLEFFTHHHVVLALA